MFSFEPGVWPPEDDPALERFWQQFSALGPGGLADTIADREAFRGRLYEKYGAGFDAMTWLHESGTDALNWAGKTLEDAVAQDATLAEYFDVMFALAGRALLAFDDVSWLLRGGSAQGAFARLRTIHELFTVAMVLAQYGQPDGPHPDLVERYVCHHEALAPWNADDLLRTDSEELRTSLNAEVLSALQRRREALIEKYGRSFGRPWGWAAPVLNGANPSFVALNDLVLPIARAHYGIASTYVHAGSEGHSTAYMDLDDETFVLTGPIDAGLAAPAELASGLLLAVLGTVIPASIVRDDGEPDRTGTYILGALLRIREQIGRGLADDMQ